MESALFGSTIRYETQTEQGESLAIRWPLSLESQKWNVGDKVSLGFPPSSVLVYPYPEQGLEKEISIE